MALACPPIGGPHGRASPPSPPPDTLFFDDFAGPELDRAKWRVQVTGRTVNNEQQAYVDSGDTIAFVQGAQADGAANGALALRAQRRPGFLTPEGRSFDFVSGRIDTRAKFEFTYGTVSARIRLTAASGLWPAFWVLGTGPWPATGEIDIMENVGESDWTSVALHGPGYSGATPLVRRAPFARNDDVTAWHVYAVDWTENALAFSVDDRPIYRVTREQVETHGRWAYDNPKYLILNLALGGDYPASVNETTSPYAGLPAATVALIASGRAEMLVDWVRISRR
jgi:beta-glucanase (GH16 family)